MPYRTFELEEAAKYLHLPTAELEKLVHENEIPFERHGGRVVFRKQAMDTWASPRILGLQGRRLAEYHQKSSHSTEKFLANRALIPELIKPAYIAPALAAKTRASVIREMVALAEKTGRVFNTKELLAGLQSREELCSTGLPGGLAILHTRQPEAYLFESQFMVLGRTIQQIPFGAPDGQGTDLFFLVACPDDRLHLHTLARLCVMVQKTDLLEQLRAALEPNSMYEVLVQSEQTVLGQL